MSKSLDNFDLCDFKGFIDENDSVIHHKLIDRLLQIEVYTYISPNDVVLSLGYGNGIIPIIINKKLYSPRNHMVVEVFKVRKHILEKNVKIHDTEFELISYLPTRQNFYFDTNLNLFLKEEKEDDKIDENNIYNIPCISFDNIVKTKYMFFTAIVCDKEYIEVLLNILTVYKYTLQIVRTIIFKNEYDLSNKTKSNTIVHFLSKLLHDNGFRNVKQSNYTYYNVWQKIL